jgi:PKD repeat protein
MSSYNKKFYWNISCFDGQNWINETFQFTTRSSGGGSSGGGSSGSSENKKPIADVSAGEPYQGFVNSAILFNGSKSYDPDGNIIKWFWVFGDNTNGTEKTVLRSYSKAGTYLVTLMVTDDDGATHTDTTTCVIIQPNRPPTTPIISGPTNGTKNTMYTFTAVSTDADNDTIKYTFNWGDPVSLSQSSGFLPNGTSFTVNHSWATAGRYNVTVTTTDNQTEPSSKITVYIDAEQTGDIGYLLDNDGNGIYDAFYSDVSKQITEVQKKDDNYLIDSNGDGNTDYVYNTDHGLTTYQTSKTPGFELAFFFCAIAVAIIVWGKKRID